MYFFFFKQKTAYEMRISDWSSDVCSSDLRAPGTRAPPACLASTNALATLFIPLLPVDVKAGGQHIALGYRPYRIKRRVVTREADIVELQLHIGVPVDRKSTRLNSSH